MGLKQTITREQLKQQIGEENIFTHYFGAWDFGNSYSSVFRKDEKNSTGFYTSKTGSIVYNDLCTGHKYDFVHFVMKLYSLNYYAALQQIAVDFGLIKGKLSGSKVGQINASIVAKKPIKKAIIVNATKFKKHHLDYWQQYGITLEELKANNIYAVDSFTINRFFDDDSLKSTFTNNDNNIKFAYTFSRDGENYIKLYTPYANQKEFKFVGDVPLTVPFGLDSLNLQYKDLIVTKSVKDCLVLRKFIPNVIGLQNESEASFDKDLLADLSSKYNLTFWFDYDRPGITAVNHYRHLGYKCVFTVNNKLSSWKNLTSVRKKQIKDPADFVKKYGINVFEQYLKYIKLI